MVMVAWAQILHKWIWNAWSVTLGFNVYIIVKLITITPQRIFLLQHIYFTKYIIFLFNWNCRNLVEYVVVIIVCLRSMLFFVDVRWREH